MLYINPDINQTDLFRNFVSSFSQRLEDWALIRIWLQHVESYGTEKEGPMKFSRLSSNIKDVGRIEFFSKTLLKSERTLDQNRVTFPVIMPKSLMLSVQKKQMRHANSPILQRRTCQTAVNCMFDGTTIFEYDSIIVFVLKCR